jgi:fucose permease
MSKKEPKDEFGLLKILAGIFKELGLPGFVIVIVVFIFFVWGTSEQKMEFIDRFILMKKAESDPFPFCLIILVLILIMIIGHVYFKKMLQIAEDENKRISEEKSRLQEQLTKKELRSSDDN